MSRKAFGSLAVAALLSPTLASADGGAAAAQQTFVAHKCDLCHAVPGADIEAKTSSDKLRGPALGGPSPEDFEFADLAAFLRKQTEREGEQHKREFKGTDEELQAILDWLETLPPPPADG